MTTGLDTVYLIGKYAEKPRKRDVRFRQDQRAAHRELAQTLTPLWWKSRRAPSQRVNHLCSRNLLTAMIGRNVVVARRLGHGRTVDGKFDHSRPYSLCHLMRERASRKGTVQRYCTSYNGSCTDFPAVYAVACGSLSSGQGFSCATPHLTSPHRTSPHLD
ncbi:hypothetical protein BDZ45DRAFT_138877 [Acephala macrosclerotiorum]|nr:hypothetical protein BDZ45DRAFT_138877 [Acephala macrosclerotiorum]